MWPAKWYWCCLVLLQWLVVYSSGQCSSKTTCRECIGTPDCYWCSEQDEGDSEKIHCIDKSKAIGEWCSSANKVEYTTSYEVLEGNNRTFQIQPQKSRLRLRLGEEYKLQIKFVKAADYPIDLYYLMDLSKSMEDDKKEIALLGGKLTETMKNLTSDFRLGFGSFVDKTTMPFVSTVPDKLLHPCPGCAPPYSFKNHMPLDIDTSLFQSTVHNASVSGNLDSPEGGFDALMQAMVCKDHIKWREDARRLLVFSTDATFHLAGDGRLAGIVEPNDGICHMDDTNEYVGGLLYDYPSIAQIDNKAVKNNINIIFAVDKLQEKIYKLLTRHITGSSWGTLSGSSRNVVDLVYNESKKLTQTVTMTGTTNKAVELHYFTRCQTTAGKLNETDKCDDVKQNDEITFEVHIKVPECPVKNETVWKSKLEFKPLGINETLEVELEVYCGCDCEEKMQQNSSSCNYKGTLKCGVCDCNEGFTGTVCECDESGSIKEGNDTSCRLGNSSEICSGHGICRCGVCNCYKRIDKEQVYSGKYCECDNFSCNRHEGRLCNGKGRCKCGKCQCSPGWKGDACQISDNRKDCIDPSTGRLCSDHGECKDGKCDCDQKYRGKYCQDCVFCPGAHCKKYADCVECLVYKTGKLTDTCNSDCNLTIIDTVDKLTEEDKGADEQFCQLPDGSSCTIIFIYKEVDGNVSVIAQNEKECRGVENVLAVVFGVIGFTILIGLIFILIWKLLTSIHDRREYAKFEKERAQSKFDRGENPLYKGAVTKFDNPTFSGN